ncbi:MAG: hypothetical protein ACYDCO_27105 [Armatimonadota bacterium]
MGKQVAVNYRRSYRPFSHTFIGTVLWVLPCMAILLVVGFIVGRDVIAPRYLEPSKVGTTITTPVRILSPAEARAAASDQPSRVWKEGVKPSDIPKLEPSEDQPRRRRRARTEPAPTANPTAPATTPAAEPEPAATEPAPVDAPAVDDSATATPTQE